MKKLLAPVSGLVIIALLSACATTGQNRYSEADVGKPTVVEFGRIVAVRDVEIDRKNTGAGAAAGAVGGGIAGAAIGRDGTGVAAGLLAGLIVGAIAESALANTHGVEYTVALRNKKVITVVQNMPEGDEKLRKGQRVMVQTSGEYMRVLPTDGHPTKIKKAKDITQVEDTTPDKEMDNDGNITEAPKKKAKKTED